MKLLCQKTVGLPVGIITKNILNNNVNLKGVQNPY
ncbi:MAG: hypothetical protein KatS3mg068_2541 [Candidatus Sericytochromatia bacterium]|nr:MAG: hypothetical protein KatS3mg068_2541 [Candidatus Sericytochromatia bacterium]